MPCKASFLQRSPSERRERPGHVLLLQTRIAVGIGALLCKGAPTHHPSSHPCSSPSPSFAFPLSLHRGCWEWGLRWRGTVSRAFLPRILYIPGSQTQLWLNPPVFCSCLSPAVHSQGWPGFPLPQKRHTTRSRFWLRQDNRPQVPPLACSYLYQSPPSQPQLLPALSLHLHAHHRQHAAHACTCSVTWATVGMGALDSFLHIRVGHDTDHPVPRVINWT